MQYMIQDVGAQVRVSVWGPLTFRDGPALAVVIQAMDEPWVREMIVDMTGVSAMDQSAVGLVRRWMARAGGQGVGLTLYGLADDLKARLSGALAAESEAEAQPQLQPGAPVVTLAAE